MKNKELFKLMINKVIEETEHTEKSIWKSVIIIIIGVIVIVLPLIKSYIKENND